MKNIYLSFLLIMFGAFSINAQTFEDSNALLPDLTFSVCSFGDFDGDNDLDLYLSGLDASSNVTGGLYVFNEGTYTLSTTSTLPAVYMGSADWGDVDGDGNIDIVIMGQNSSYVDITEVYKNNGDGTFTSLSAGIEPTEQGEVTFADFNGDTFLDISLSGIGTNDRITKLYTNDGTGVYTEVTSFSLPGMNYGRIKWADYDNDTDLDFVLSGYNDEDGGTNTFFTEIYTNNGDGTFSVSGISLHQGWLGDTEWGDYNGDGNIDLVISGTGGDGSERFTLLYKNDGVGGFTELDPGFPGVSHSGLEWGDFDGDGDLDLFIVGETTTPGDGNSVSKIFNNDGGDVFSESSVNNLSFSYFGDADSGDFDNDGKIDIVITGYSEASYGASNSAVYKNTTPVSVSFVEKNISFSPIPARNYLKLESEKLISKIEVYNLSGKCVLSTKLNTKIATINIENLNSGIYFVKIQTSTSKFSKKIIVE